MKCLPKYLDIWPKKVTWKKFREMFSPKNYLKNNSCVRSLLPCLTAGQPEMKPPSQWKPFHCQCIQRAQQEDLCQLASHLINRHVLVKISIQHYNIGSILFALFYYVKKKWRCSNRHKQIGTTSTESNLGSSKELA